MSLLAMHSVPKGNKSFMSVYRIYFFLCLSGQAVYCISNHPLVFVISMDGFRHDYVEECLTPTINSLLWKGVYAPFMKNVFPTKTFPNHHSIATGVYPEVHGVLDSEVYISKECCSNRSVVGYSYELFHYNNDLLPIWTLNQLAGRNRHSGVMMWPGGEFPYGCKKTLPTFFQKLDLNISFEHRVDIIMSWFTDPKTPANLVFLYLEEPDFHGHAFGINSIEAREQLKKVDRAIKYIQQKLHDHKIHDIVNVFVLSDHGMINFDQRNIIDLNLYVDNTLYIAGSLSPALQIFPKQGQEDIVHIALQAACQKSRNAFDVYKREEIPSAWHFSQNNRTPPLLAVAKEGYAFQDILNTINGYNKKFNIEPNPRNKYGIHGYSNDIQSMFPIFFGWGPHLKTNTSIDPFNTVDLYPTWAHILSLKLDDFEYSLPVFSMLSSTVPNSSSTQNESLPSTLITPLTVVSAATWTHWVAGIFAFIILIGIFGVVAYYFRDLKYRNCSESASLPTLGQFPRPCHAFSGRCPCRCHYPVTIACSRQRHGSTPGQRAYHGPCCEPHKHETNLRMEAQGLLTSDSEDDVVS